MKLLGRKVSPLTHEVFKFFPNNPPERGGIVLIDGVRCRVIYCRVKWEGRQWTIQSLRVKESAK